MTRMDLMKISVERFPKKVKQYAEEHSHSRGNLYISFIEYKRGEVIERVFAARRYKRKGVLITEILRKSTGKSKTVCKNLLFAPVCGYVPVYEARDKYSNSGGYAIKIFPKEEFDVWDIATVPVGIDRKVVNADMLRNIEEFKYCGYSGGDVISYLTMYRKDKHVEMFGKLCIRLSPVLMRKAKTDGKFRRFLWENHVAIEMYGVQATLYAYEHDVTVDEARRICYLKNQLDRLVVTRIPAISGTSLDRGRVLDYVDYNHINYASYNDYLIAIKALKYDLSDTKNIYPKDFTRMHELRASEYASFMAKEDKRKRSKLYKAFAKKAEQAKKYEAVSAEFVIVAPRGIEDLKREGAVLQHCVGKMGYDKKVADGVSLIMFCRKSDSPHVPFVTIEYRLDIKRLNQCYGLKDSRPPEDVIDFVNAWATNITNSLKGD